MKNKVYTCLKDIFNSYLKTIFISFVEYKVNVSGCTPESFIPVLKRFDQYCSRYPEKEICLKAESVHGFLELQNVKISTLQRIECVIRSFGKYMVLVLQIQDAYIIPHIIKSHGKTFVPYVFSLDEISALFAVADTYRLTCHNKPTTNIENGIRCIIKVLYCTGMRVSEVCYLKISDVDLKKKLININHAKNDNHRIVTISESLSKEIQRYLDESSKHNSTGKYFFDSGSTLNDGQVSSKCVYVYFRRYLKLADIEHKGTGFGPRLHDLRVTFAVHSLKKLTETVADVNACLTYLSTYMGHQSLQETQDYLWLCKDLFKSTLARMDDYTSFISEIFDNKAGDCYD
jgi:integrase/recombinase XerD